MNHDCKLFEQDLVLYGTHPTEDLDLFAHLEGCASCRQAVTSSRTLWQLLEDYEAPEPGVDLVPWLGAQIASTVGTAARGTFREWVRRSWSPPHLAIAGSVLACLGLLMGAWTGSLLMTSDSARSPSATELTNEYSSIFDASPPGFLRAADPLDGQETSE